MTKFLDKSFSTYSPGDRRYADNWERTFGKMNPPRTHEAECPCPRCCNDRIVAERRLLEAPPEHPNALLEAAHCAAIEWLDWYWPYDDWKSKDQDSLVALLLRFRGLPEPA